MNVCKNLKPLREKQGITQVELAELTGINERTIRFFEQGLKSPSVITLIHIADALGCSLEEITGFKVRKD
ncbi:MAG: helix-turn-helix domain-containing protein [Ruminococcus sp.]|nr:helix-turn-helix domain-containing protein [Ruminococcus sp.]